MGRGFRQREREREREDFASRTIERAPRPPRLFDKQCINAALAEALAVPFALNGSGSALASRQGALIFFLLFPYRLGLAGTPMRLLALILALTVASASASAPLAHHDARAACTLVTRHLQFTSTMSEGSWTDVTAAVTVTGCDLGGGVFCATSGSISVSGSALSKLGHSSPWTIPLFPTPTSPCVPESYYVIYQRLIDNRITDPLTITGMGFTASATIYNPTSLHNWCDLTSTTLECRSGVSDYATTISKRGTNTGAFIINGVLSAQVGTE